MSKSVFAVIDCNNFFVSCERAFRPDLIDKPVMVLSNNDGCAISRSNEVKALGIPMGAPAFKYKDILREHDVAQFSVNFSLYGDFSTRVMNIVEQFTPDVEVYSIDEAFVRLDGLAEKDYTQLMLRLRQQILQWTGIPVSIGIGYSKTQSKVAVDWAKKQTESGVFDLTSVDNTERDELYAQMAVREIWGIGRQLDRLMTQYGVKSIADFCGLSHGWLLQNVKSHGVKLQQELFGQSIWGLEPQKFEWRKNIMATRSFGDDVTEIHELEQAIAAHMARASRKLRRQQGVVQEISIFAATGKHRSTDYVKLQASTMLSAATNYAPELVRRAVDLVPDIYQKGINYYRCGVYLTHIMPEVQLNVFEEFDELQHQKQRALMQAFDGINQKWGDNTVRVGAQGLSKGWCSKQQHRSQDYTHDWTQLPQVVVA